MSSVGCYIRISLLFSIVAHAADVNVTLNKPVTLNGDFSSYVSKIAPCRGDKEPSQKPATSVVDGIIPTEGTCYQEGVYWNKDNPDNSIDINLGGTFLLSSAIVQADNNDTYTLQYRDTAGAYHDWWIVPRGSFAGLENRPDRNNHTQRQTLPKVTATGLRFLAPKNTPDGEYSVSEIQVFGSSVNLVDIGESLFNPSFVAATGQCPNSWTCDGSPAPGFSSYAPSTAQYPGGFPVKTSAFSPTVFGGSGTIRQISHSFWTGGTTYVLNLWKGLPKTLPDGTTFVEGWAPTARLYLTTPEREQVAAFDISKPAKGTFESNPIIFTLPANSPFIGKQVTVVLFISAPSRFSANFAITRLFSEVTGAAEHVSTFDFSHVQFSGWVNFSGATGHIEMDMLKNGNASIHSEKDWSYVANFSPEQRLRPPLGDAGNQYNWQVDIEIRTPSWPVGGMQRFRFRPVIDEPNSGFRTTPNQLLPVVEAGFQHRRLEWILADTRFTATEGKIHGVRPKFLEVGKGQPDAHETLKYYKHVGTNSDGSGQSIEESISTKEEFVRKYFGPIPEKATATYYNRGDLGIGRQMHCSKNVFSQETACYVENYGAVSADHKTGLAAFASIQTALEALLAEKPFATVAMVERGKMPFGTPNKVFFVVYGDGEDPADCPKELRCEAKLDNFGDNTSIPGNCIVCHGGGSEYSYPSTGPQVTNAYFLPFDLQSFDYFSMDDKNPRSRVYQEPAFQRLNLMVYFTDLFYNPDAKSLMDGWFSGNGTFKNDFVPPGWEGNANDKRLYGEVVAQTCRTCHISHTPLINPKLGASDPLRFGTFDDFAANDDALPVLFLTCISHAAFSMPNAEQTSNIFWKGPARAQLLDGLDSPLPCGLSPPAASSAVQSISTLQLSGVGALQQYKAESCTCTTKECLKQVDSKYLEQISTVEFDTSAALIFKEMMKCRQQIAPKPSSPTKTVEELVLEHDLAQAKMFGP